MECPSEPFFPFIFFLYSVLIVKFNHLHLGYTVNGVLYYNSV
jgi:hypothetical protein